MTNHANLSIISYTIVWQKKFMISKRVEKPYSSSFQNIAHPSYASPVRACKRLVITTLYYLEHNEKHGSLAQQ